MKPSKLSQSETRLVQFALGVLGAISIGAVYVGLMYKSYRKKHVGPKLEVFTAATSFESTAPVPGAIETHDFRSQHNQATDVTRDLDRKHVRIVTWNIERGLISAHSVWSHKYMWL